MFRKFRQSDTSVESAERIEIIKRRECGIIAFYDKIIGGDNELMFSGSTCIKNQDLRSIGLVMECDFLAVPKDFSAKSGCFQFQFYFSAAFNKGPVNAGSAFVFVMRNRIKAAGDRYPFLIKTPEVLVYLDL